MTTIGGLASLLLLTGTCLFSMPADSDGGPSARCLSDLRRMSKDIRIMDIRGGTWILIDALKETHPPEVVVVCGIDGLPSSELRELNRRRGQLQGPTGIVLVLKPEDEARLRRLAPDLRAVVQPIDDSPDSDDNLTTGLRRALALASVLPHDPEADRITDELIRGKTQGWTTRPLTRRAKG